MVKGVNKQIIEINDTGNKYFERILLFVSPGKKDLPSELLQTKAKEYVLEFSKTMCDSVPLREKIRRKRARKRAIMISAAVALITASTLLIINIL